MNLSKDQEAEMLRWARRIRDDDQREAYFKMVADALRRRKLTDAAVRRACETAFKLSGWQR
jgi:hypothetical protein